MVNKTSSCVFISGNGSNLKSIVKSSRNHNFPIKIELIISNNIKSRGLYFAKKYSIPYKFFPCKNRKIFERNCLFEIKKRRIKFLCLAGFMKLLSNNFIKSFGYKIINIHPSLLPKYKGLSRHERVISNNEKFSGCTVHYVTTKLDSGNIILQKKVKISKTDTEKTLKRNILKQEHKLYTNAIKKIFN